MDDIDDRLTQTDLFEPLHDAPAPEGDGIERLREPLSAEFSAALDELPHEQYEVLVRADLCGQSVEQIARLLSIPAWKVGSRLALARDSVGRL